MVSSGTGTTVWKSSPTTVPLANVIRVAAGRDHTCATPVDGSARCWGANAAGHLGDGTTGMKLVPTAVLSLSGAAQITAGAAHSCARLSSGALQCWGSNSAGELGDGTVSPRSTPTFVQW